MPLEQGPELWRQGPAGRYYYNGQNKPSYFGAVYEHLDDDLTCEGTIGLRTASEVELADDGLAIAWAMAHTED